MFREFAKPLSFLLIFSFLLLDFTAVAAKAGMVGTEEVVTAMADQEARSRIAAFLDREEARQAMAELGVDPAEAKVRVASLSDQEVMKLSRQLDELPAGGDAIGALVGAAVFVFVVLLITDIVGLTNVFPFVRHHHH